MLLTAGTTSLTFPPSPLGVSLACASRYCSCVPYHLHSHTAAHAVPSLLLALRLLALCRSLLQSEDDVHDTHQDQFRQFQQQAHAIVQELQELEGATW